ncbi:transporter [Marinithermofilum abyssi]|uniref:Transporter n=1 Tax=Marinithermofilum abyssi TaxID=1571185 RepID=A0A8J2VD71_9BACL|nr:hypothetical protein [Marinithermofilum abyssi]GGE23346.1 transporter [Marinithermofilum abyssi]
MELSLAHVAYGMMTLLLITVMLLRKGVVLPALAGTFLVAWVYRERLAGGIQSLFLANLEAARELFSIFLIITFMVALLRAMEELGADRKMIAPVQTVMVNGNVAFWLLAGVTYVLSLFFWPTPAVPLICALLVPAAIRAGLPAMGCAVVVALAGQGMALSSDFVMQVAPTLSAKAAGVDPGDVADKALILSLITGGIALGWSYIRLRPDMGKAGVHTGRIHQQRSLSDNASPRSEREKWGSRVAWLVPLALLVVMLYMLVKGNEGIDGAALIGGTGALLLLAVTAAGSGWEALDRISDHLVEGFLFAFRAMGPVIPIAGFFFLGSKEYAGTILSTEHSPALLFDLVQSGQELIPHFPLLTAMGILIIGMLTGLDGSGFSGLPLTGGLADALAASSGVDPAVLAAIGQMGCIWAGGGTLIAWSSLVAVAGLTRVSVGELVRQNFLPVVAGLIVSTLVALILW